MQKSILNATPVVAVGASPAMFSNPEFGSVRIIVKENGEPLFCLRDICDILEVGKTSEVKERLDEADVVTIAVSSKSSNGTIQNRDTVFVNESGLYDVILDSRKPNARAFRKWVTSEVLPSIRKTETSEITSCISKDSVTEITVVNFLGRDIHVLGTPEDPLFIAKDVAEWIGQSDVSSMCRVLEICDTEKVRITYPCAEGRQRKTQEVLAITEQGLYKILWRSNKPEAQKFASKCADIIKEIRLKGSYSVAQQQPSYQIPQTFSEALQLAADIQKENERLALENKKQATKIEEDAPKLDVYNQFIASKNNVHIRTFVKMIQDRFPKVKEAWIFKNLREAGILQSHGFFKNIPYAEYGPKGKGYFTLKQSAFGATPLLTPKGQEWCFRMIKDYYEAAGDIEDMFEEDNDM